MRLRQRFRYASLVHDERDSHSTCQHEPEDSVLLSNPPMWRCKHCKATFVLDDHAFSLVRDP